MGRLTRIHVNQHNIRANNAVCGGEKLPVITVKDYKENRKGFEAVIGNGIARVVYAPDNPLSCGAKVWIETREEVTVL